MAESLDPDGTRALLNDWSESEVEVMVRGKDSDAWLARFAGTLGIDTGAGSFTVHIGGDEAWVYATPHTFEEGVLHREKAVLVVRHADGQTTIRKKQ